MSQEEKYDALLYCSNTYTNRNFSYNLSQLFPPETKGRGKRRKGKRPNTTVYTFEDERIDAFIAREAIKDFKEGKDIPRGSYIPPYKKREVSK